MTTILVPLDGSKLAEEVLPVARDLARKLNATVRFIEVYDALARTAASRAAEASGILLPAAEAESKRIRETAEEYLTIVTNRWKAQDINADWEVAEGRPATRIVEAARTHQADMIAMCTHCRSGLARLAYGSVANEVVKEAGIPVLLVSPSHK